MMIGLLAIPLVLLVRFVSVGVPMGLFKRKRKYNPHTIGILTWGGLRGGISVALALSLTKISTIPTDVKETILFVTYCIVVFSILVQGLTIKNLLK